ncbi:MAG: hypothetical protein LBR85_04985 [Oscillospiraceae bacterium]|jgi:uncharacterized membrane protein YfcA|nr:hypothetical protein [Oscillospiraceae bacterium]
MRGLAALLARLREGRETIEVFCIFVYGAGAAVNVAYLARRVPESYLRFGYIAALVCIFLYLMSGSRVKKKPGEKVKISNRSIVFMTAVSLYLVTYGITLIMR